MDSTHGILSDLLGPAAEDVASLADVPRQVGSQAQAHRQAAAAVALSHSAGDGDLLGHMDNLGVASGRMDSRLERAQVQAVRVQLVG